MDDIDSILDALADALELERELGARTFDIDRSLLVAPVATPKTPVKAVAPASSAAALERPAPLPAADRRSDMSFFFVHDRPLSPKGEEMMTKIVAAMGKTRQTAPVVVEDSLPSAPVVVVLGSRALKRFFPGMRGSPGQWLKSSDGRDMLVSRSPDELLRFGEETPAVKKMKWEMWQSLKTVVQRTRK